MEPGWTPDQLLKVYIYDYMRRRNFHTTAEILKEEALITDDQIKAAIHVPEGFLVEWFNLFYDLYRSRMTREAAQSSVTVDQKNEESIPFSAYELPPLPNQVFSSQAQRRRTRERGSTSQRTSQQKLKQKVQAVPIFPRSVPVPGFNPVEANYENVTIPNFFPQNPEFLPTPGSDDALYGERGVQNPGMQQPQPQGHQVFESFRYPGSHGFTGSQAFPGQQTFPGPEAFPSFTSFLQEGLPLSGQSSSLNQAPAYGYSIVENPSLPMTLSVGQSSGCILLPPNHSGMFEEFASHYSDQLCQGVNSHALPIPMRPPTFNPGVPLDVIMANLLHVGVANTVNQNPDMNRSQQLVPSDRTNPNIAAILPLSENDVIDAKQISNEREIEGVFAKGGSAAVDVKQSCSSNEDATKKKAGR